MENVHYNAFRDHMMGQPKKGDRDNCQNLTVDMLRDYHSANYYGDNTVIIGVGNINHDEFVQQVQDAFHSLPKSASASRKNTEKPIFNPALLFIRDDEMYNSNVGVFYDAPTPKHPDHFSFILLRHMIGDYRIDKHSTHLNDMQKQYNAMHTLLGDLVDVTKQNCTYLSYSDCAMFGNYFFGNEVFTRQMNYCGVAPLTIYGHYMNDVEVIRGRNNLYCTLMEEINNPFKTFLNIGRQLHFYGRRMHGSEIAKRVSYADAYYMKQLCYDWFYDAEPTFTNWGPVESVSCVGSYKYFKINTMSTVTNMHHSLYY